MSEPITPTPFTRLFKEVMHQALQRFGSVTRENEAEVTRWVQTRIRDRKLAIDAEKAQTRA